MPSIFGKEGKRVVVRDFLPEELPLQPFEGAPEDIALIGDALRDAQRNERLRLTFFGASHTGGEYWTGHIRRVLQTRYGDGADLSCCGLYETIEHRITDAAQVGTSHMWDEQMDQ